MRLEHLVCRASRWRAVVVGASPGRAAESFRLLDLVGKEESVA
jgi:hypothetical protein